MNPHLQRGYLLYQQSRYDLAATELRQALALEPQNAYPHALLALCLTELEKFNDAIAEVQQAIHLAPDEAFSHYAHARVLYDRKRYAEALIATKEAIRLDSSDADYFALLAQLHLEQRQWTEALQAAETGLQFDSEHVGCTNLRAMAMVNLGRRAEAGATIDAALARNPDNAVTHANQGWTLLHQGDPKKALEHFREALRLDPTNEWARHGIVEALKARNIIYAGMLKYFLWMSRLSRQAQWGILLGGVFGIRILSGLERSHPNLAPWILPVQVLYVTFVVLSWTAYPMFNLLLRLNRFGRHALTPEQNVEANWVGASFFLALISLSGCLIAGFESAWLVSLIVFGFMLIPLSGVFRCATGWPRTIMIVMTIGLALIGLSAIGLIWKAALGSGDAESVRANASTAIKLLGTYSTGIFVASLLVNILATQRPTR